MEKVGIFFGKIGYITAVWNILWPFSNLVAIWYIFPSFGQEKSVNPVWNPVLKAPAASSVLDVDVLRDKESVTGNRPDVYLKHFVRGENEAKCKLG
jgi:hypothetical protein